MTIAEEFITASITEHDSEITLLAKGLCSRIYFDDVKAAEVLPVSFQVTMPPNVSVFDSILRAEYLFEADYITGIVTHE